MKDSISSPIAIVLALLALAFTVLMVANPFADKNKVQNAETRSHVLDVLQLGNRIDEMEFKESQVETVWITPEILAALAKDNKGLQLGLQTDGNVNYKIVTMPEKKKSIPVPPVAGKSWWWNE